MRDILLRPGPLAIPPRPGAAGFSPGKRQGAVILNRRNGDRRLSKLISAAGEPLRQDHRSKTLLLLLLEPSPREKLHIVNVETQVGVPVTV